MHHVKAKGLWTRAACLLAPYVLLVGYWYGVRPAMQREALISASIRGDTASVRQLLVAGVDINTRDVRGHGTPLMMAASMGRFNTVSLLLARGAALDARNAYGNTALILAAGKGELAVVRLLVGAGADASIRNNRGRTASDIACAAGYSEICRLLRTQAGPSSGRRLERGGSVPPGGAVTTP